MSDDSIVNLWKAPWYDEANKAYNAAIINDENDRLTALSDAVDAAINSYLIKNNIFGNFNFKDQVFKIKGSSWRGHICGFYSTKLTPIGYAVESQNEPGSVKIYPESALSKL